MFDEHVFFFSYSKNAISYKVRKTAVLPATANAIILSRTATGDGTLIGNAISSVTTSTCMWPPIPTVISLYFRFWNGLPGMICFLFYTLFSP